MIMTRAHRVAQSGKPCPLDQPRVQSELRPSYSSGIKGFDIVGIYLELLFFQILGPVHEPLDALLDLWIGGVVYLSDEAVARILPGVHGPHLVELAHEQRRDQMIAGKNIIRMLLDDLLKLLCRPVIVEIVEVF